MGNFFSLDPCSGPMCVAFVKNGIVAHFMTEFISFGNLSLSCDFLVSNSEKGSNKGTKARSRE